MQFFTLTKQTALNILHDKVLVSLLALSFGLFAGVMFYQVSSFQASLIQTPSTLEASELNTIFTDYKNIKESEISPLTENTFLVEFFATENEGDALHPFSFVVEKSENTIIAIKEIENDIAILEDEFINEAQDIEVTPLQ